MPLHHNLNPGAPEFKPAENIDLVSNETVFHDNSYQATPESLASSSGGATADQTENPVGTRRSGRQRRALVYYKAKDWRK